MTERGAGLDALRAELAASLESGAAFAAQHDILRRHRDNGIGQRDAYDVLVGLRGATGSQHEDRILDLLDVVWGFCSADLRLWAEPLSSP